MQRPASYKEILDVATKAVSIFAASKVSCCVTGDTACALYGTPRRPAHELDLLVLTNRYPREKLEKHLVSADPDFYLWSPRDAPAQHRVLCYKLSGAPGEPKRGCKVNVVLPDNIGMPVILPSKVQRIDDLPVMPLLLLLFLKLQCWTDRRVTLRWYMRSKQHDEDVRDIRDLLVLVRSRGECIDRDRLQWLPTPTVEAAIVRITEFVEAFPDTTTNWRVVGYAPR